MYPVSIPSAPTATSRSLSPPRPPLQWALEPTPIDIDPEQVMLAGLRNHHIANTAYPIAHRKTIWGYRRSSDEAGLLLARALRATDRMSLYAHIPFCERRCSYCEYCVLDHHDAHVEQAYHAALDRELDTYLDRVGLRGHTLAGFDIGGGTPTLVDASRIEALVRKVVGSFSLSPTFGISIETTPRIAALQPDKLAAIRAMGIDRISMGLQMASDHLLAAYGRDTHRSSDNARAADSIRKAGFRKFNIDVMYGFAQQSVQEVEQTIAAAAALHPDVITVYRMRYKGTRVLPEAPQIGLDRVVDMAHAAHQALASHGFFAPVGKNTFSRTLADPGTSAYLTERVIGSVPYLGLGLGAQTFTNNLLAYNQGAASKRMDTYLSDVAAGRLPIQDIYLLPRSEGMAKMVSVSFYFGSIHLDAFRQRFGVSLEDRFPRQVDYLLSHGYMQYAGRTLRLTDAGAARLPGVIAQFYANAVKQHLLSL